MVLLNHSTPAQALAFADRLRAAIAAASVAVPGGHAPVCVTASLGLAVAPSGQVELDELLQQADQAMYQAKRAGRDRVTLAGAEIEAEAGS